MCWFSFLFSFLILGLSIILIPTLARTLVIVFTLALGSTLDMCIVLLLLTSSLPNTKGWWVQNILTTRGDSYSCSYVIVRTPSFTLAHALLVVLANFSCSCYATFSAEKNEGVRCSRL